MQLTDRVYLIGSGSEGFQMTGHFDCHVYLIAGKDELAVIDAGAGMAVSQIVENIRRHGFEANQVRHLLLTHAHMDHVGGAAKLRAALGDPRVYIHADCAEFLRKGDEVGTSWNVAKEVWGFPKDFRFEACAVDVELQDGDVVRVGEFLLQTIATPGHSIGHVSFLMEEGGRRILFGGDHVFFGGRIRLQKLWIVTCKPTSRASKNCATPESTCCCPAMGPSCSVTVKSTSITHSGLSISYWSHPTTSVSATRDRIYLLTPRCKCPIVAYDIED